MILMKSIELTKEWLSKDIKIKLINANPTHVLFTNRYKGDENSYEILLGKGNKYSLLSSCRGGITCVLFSIVYSLVNKKRLSELSSD